MTLREDIRTLYKENRSISGTQILERLGRKSTPTFWRILNDEQVGMRGVYPSKRKNRSMPRAVKRGVVRWIPPKER